jgi:spore coat polysaccharide biosynthesis protein SpsF (cytidylyltransferase family)
MGALAIVQARMSSTRLPGKTLADVEGEPLLGLLLARLGRAATPDRIVVATSDREDDDAIAAFVAEAAPGVGVARGPLDDVLARFALALGDHPGPVVRITADCPLIDPAVVDALVTAFAAAGPGARYGSNIDPRTFPDGLDAEVFTRAALLDAAAHATGAQAREHVTPFLRAQGVDVAIESGLDLGAERWTVDTAADLAFVRAVVARLGERRHAAPLAEVLEAVRRPPALAAAVTPSPT